jgi:hypothetical protein
MSSKLKNTRGQARLAYIIKTGEMHCTVNEK